MRASRAECCMHRRKRSFSVCELRIGQLWPRECAMPCAMCAIRQMYCELVAAILWHLSDVEDSFFYIKPFFYHLEIGWLGFYIKYT